MSQLGCWEGYRISNWRYEQRKELRWLVIELMARARRKRRCSGCGEAVTGIHDRSCRRIRDLPVFDCPVELQVERLRVACPRCGPRLEQLSWLDAYARITRRLAESVARLCAATSIRTVARWFGLDWKTVKTVDFEQLQRTLGPVDFSDVTVLAMDEFAIQKGHRYATVSSSPSASACCGSVVAAAAPMCGPSSNCWVRRDARVFAPWRWT